MDTEALRQESVEEARRLGCELNPGLPLLDSDLRLRSQDDAVRRCLARYAAVAVAYGFGRRPAKKWLKRERLTDALAGTELAVLKGGDADFLRPGVESLWAFCWAFGLVERLDYSAICGDNLITLLPDLKSAEPSAPFFDKARLRPLEEVAGAVDLAYSLHWALAEAGLTGGATLGRVSPLVVVERRHALEWLIGDEDWDDVPLDT